MRVNQHKVITPYSSHSKTSRSIKNVARAVRFYREVFDLPTEFEVKTVESRHLYFDQQSIAF